MGLRRTAIRSIPKNVDAAHTTRPRLGRVLVDAGLLTEEQLEAALKEQTQSGRRLGEIVVERGYLSGPALANALATQHGGVVRTEYGIATGLGTPAGPRVPASSPEVTSPSPASGSEVAPESEPPAQAEPEPATEPAQTLSLLHVLEDWSGLLEDRCIPTDESLFNTFRDKAAGKNR